MRKKINNFSFRQQMSDIYVYTYILSRNTWNGFELGLHQGKVGDFTAVVDSLMHAQDEIYIAGLRCSCFLPR